MAIDSIDAIETGDTTQWMRVRGADESNPVLLLIQFGPGLPLMSEARRIQHLLRLEDDFTVVYWDQRGCGRSLRNQTRAVEISVERMVDDTVALLASLRDRFGAPAYVAGFSLGAAVGAYAATRRPDLVAALVAVGMDIDGRAAGEWAYDFALGTARARGNRRAVSRLEAIGPPPHLNLKQFATRAGWVANFGGVATNETRGSLLRKLLVGLVRSPDYSLGDVIRTVRGITRTQAALLRDLADLDLVETLPRIDVPVVMAQGRLDAVAPGGTAARYFNLLSAPSKHFVWFENSAHTPHLEEPAKFRDLLLQVPTGPLARASDGARGGPE